jgi:hypothetical protein
MPLPDDEAERSTPVRVVLAKHPDGLWRLYRQSGWIHQVRRDPLSSGWARRVFDLPSREVRACLVAIEPRGRDLTEALAILTRGGASEITAPTQAERD